MVKLRVFSVATVTFDSWLSPLRGTPTAYLNALRLFSRVMERLASDLRTVVRLRLAKHLCTRSLGFATQNPRCFELALTRLGTHYRSAFLLRKNFPRFACLPCG